MTGDHRKPEQTLHFPHRTGKYKLSLGAQQQGVCLTHSPHLIALGLFFKVQRFVCSFYFLIPRYLGLCRLARRVTNCSRRSSKMQKKKKNSAKNGGFKNQILITWRYSCQVDGKEAVHHIQTGKSPWVYFTANYSGLTY